MIQVLRQSLRQGSTEQWREKHGVSQTYVRIYRWKYSSWREASIPESPPTRSSTRSSPEFHKIVTTCLGEHHLSLRTYQLPVAAQPAGTGGLGRPLGTRETAWRHGRRKSASRALRATCASRARRVGARRCPRSPALRLPRAPGIYGA